MFEQDYLMKLLLAFYQAMFKSLTRYRRGRRPQRGGRYAG